MDKKTPVYAISTTKEKLKLIGIIIFIMIAGALMGTLYGFNFQEWLRWFMGGFMIMFGAFKLVSIEVFARVFPYYDLIAKRFSLYKYIYPLLQILLGMFFIIGTLDILRDILTILAGTSGAIGISRLVSERGPVKLAYFGKVIRLRYSTVCLIENCIMIVGGLLMLLSYFLR